MKFNKYKISHYFIFFFSGINYFIAILLNIFLRKKNNNILLFGQKLVGNLEAIFKDPRLSDNNIFFMTLNYKDYLMLKKQYGKRVLTPLNVSHLFKGLKSNIIVASHGIFLHKLIKILGIKTILCGHSINGAIPKNMNKTKNYFELFDEVWLHSPYDEKIVTNELLCKTFNLNVIGYPRNQILIENNKTREKLRVENNLSDKKVILYAPTSNRGNKDYIKSEFSPFNEYFYNFVTEELLNSNIILIIKTHYKDTIPKKIKVLLKNNKNVFLQDDMNVENDYDVMILSDILITDLSTVYVDYLLLEKPIFFINNPNPDPGMKRSSILTNVNLSKINNKEEFKNMINKIKENKLNVDNIQKLKHNIYESLDHLKTIEKINDIFLKDSN